MTANPNTACKPLGAAQEEHIMHCTVCQPDGAWTMQAWKSFHSAVVAPRGIERNCLGHLYIPNAADGTFEGWQQALKSLSSIST